MENSDVDLGKGWHIDKRFTVGHVITTLVVGISAIMYITTVEKRVALLEAKSHNQDQRFEQMTDHMLRQYDQITGHLIRIETKLDRKVDK